MSPKTPKEKDDAEVTCPVCAGVVTLEDPFCPHCGAEFEEEEVEEVVEEEISTVERVPEAPAEEAEPSELSLKGEEPEPWEPPEEVPPEAPLEELPAEPAVESELFEEPEEPEELKEPTDEVEEAEAAPAALPRRAAPEPVASSITDLRVIGISLLMLGIVGAIVMLNIKWFWLWVPAIQNNILVYGIIGAAIILVSFLLFWKMSADKERGKSPPHPMLPAIMLSMILFGFMTVVLFILSGPITSALKASNIGVSIVFIAMVAVGLFIYFYESRARGTQSSGTA